MFVEARKNKIKNIKTFYNPLIVVIINRSPLRLSSFFRGSDLESDFIKRVCGFGSQNKM